MDDNEPQKATERLYKKVCEDVGSRKTWLERQRTWYDMRHDGLRRKNKPWPWAADLHYPLSDTTIDKLKPFYFNQLFGTETVAQFIPKLPELAPFAQEVAYWNDWKLKQNTNLETELLTAIDRMLMTGHAPVRVGWDGDKKQVYFDAIEPTHCIVPDNTEKIEDADRITIVHHQTKNAYLRDDRWNAPGAKKADFIDRIVGAGRSSDISGSNSIENSKQIREGITHGRKDSDLIIIWETWEHRKDRDWNVHWYSPLAPEQPVRNSIQNPFEHGKCPIVRFDYEIKDKGWYASRGVVEKMAAFENYICRVWNEKADSMTLFNRPMFAPTGSPIPNAGNLRFMPGQILPAPMQAITFGRPPISFDEEMNNARGVAELNIGVPDYGIGQQNDKNDSRTATEVDAIGAQASVGVDLKSRTFRIALAELLQLAWATLIQFDKDTQYYIGSEVKDLPPDALKSGAWMVQPNGSSDSWNKPKQLQRAIARKQLFGPSQGYPQGAPWINQSELDKSILEIDDPRLVSRLFIDPNEKQREEYEDEAKLLPTLLLGMPLQGDPGEDQMTRIKCLMDFMRAQSATGTRPTPQATAAIDARLKEHLAILHQKDPKAAMGIAKMIDQEAAHHAGNVVAMPTGADAGQNSNASGQPPTDGNAPAGSSVTQSA